MYLHVAILLFAGASALNETAVDYFVDIITRDTEQALNYVLPKDASEYKANSSEIQEFGSYDYVIIGSGSAGSVAATRLSDTNYSVLVLEAGTFENDFVDIPYMYVYVQSSIYNWEYRSIPQKSACLGMVDGRCPYPRGRGFGGTSLLNGLIYARGNRLDFDRWERLGNPGWSYKDVLPYFIRQENADIDNAEPGYHGRGGPLNVEYYRPYSPQFYAFIDANLELGRKELDYNGRHQLGVSRIQLNTLRGRRDSSSRAFLYPVRHRKNLHLLNGSYVTKIHINNATRTAYQVEFTRNGSRYVVKAGNEIVLCAGAIGSPQILMLSGVGPADHLKRLKIPLVQNLDVGKNVDDHPTFYGLNILSNSSEPTASVRQYVINYLNASGPYTIPGSNQGLGFFQTNLTNTPGLPDVEVMVVPSNRSSTLSQRSYSFTNESAEALWGSINNTSTFTFYFIVLHPVSRGTIKLKSSDPFEYPLIDSRFLSDPEDKDIETMYQGIQLGLEMLNTTAMKRINATLGKVVHPNCASHEYLSKSYWYCTIRHYTMNLYHPISACKMGPNPRKGAVVDPRFRVHGIKRLRVADTSVIPFSLSGHPNAVAMMLGERVADFVKQSAYN